jgi:hypothetical protein
MKEPPHTSIEAKRQSSCERAAYRWLLELLLDGFDPLDRRDAGRAVVSAADGTVFVWRYLRRDHCPRCGVIRAVYLCDRTRSLACLCRVCRTLHVFDGIGRPICLAVSGVVATDDLPPDAVPRPGLVGILAARSACRVLPFVALWPLRPDRRTLTATPRPVAEENRR